MEPQAGFEPAASSLPRKRSNRSKLLGLVTSIPCDSEIKFSDCLYCVRLSTDMKSMLSLVPALLQLLSLQPSEFQL